MIAPTQRRGAWTPELAGTGVGRVPGELWVLAALTPILVSRWDVVAAVLLGLMAVVGGVRFLGDGRITGATTAFAALFAVTVLSAIGAGTIPPHPGWVRFFATDGRVLLTIAPALALGAGAPLYGPAHLRRPFMLVGALLGAEAMAHMALAGGLFTGTLSSHHAAGALAAVTIIVLVAARTDVRAVTLDMAIVGAALALALSGSRASLLGVLAALTVTGVRRATIGRRLLVGAGVLAVALASVSLVPRFSELPRATVSAVGSLLTEERLERSSEISVTQRNTALRVDAWRVAARTGADSPLWGAGAFTSDDIITSELELERAGGAAGAGGVNSVFSAHNAYLYAFAELGLIGVLLHSLPYVLLWRSCRPHRLPTSRHRASARAASGVLVLVAVAGLTNVTVASPAVTLPVLAVCYAFRPATATLAAASERTRGSASASWDRMAGRSATTATTAPASRSAAP